MAVQTLTITRTILGINPIGNNIWQIEFNPSQTQITLNSLTAPVIYYSSSALPVVLNPYLNNIGNWNTNDYNAIMNNQLSETNANPLENVKQYAPSQTLSSENEIILNTNIDKLTNISDTVTNLKSNIENHQDTILGVKLNEANKYYKPDGSIVQGTDGITFDVKELTDKFPKDANGEYYKSAKSDTILQYNPLNKDNMKNVTGAIFGSLWSNTNNIGGNIKNTTSEFSNALIADFTGLPSNIEFDPASLLIDSTNFLCAPLCNNLYYTNSTANINKNSSQDVRGDICVKFNNAGNMFNNSTIYGEPRIINRLGECSNNIPKCML